MVGRLGPKFKIWISEKCHFSPILATWGWLRPDQKRHIKYFLCSESVLHTLFEFWTYMVDVKVIIFLGRNRSILTTHVRKTLKSQFFAFFFVFFRFSKAMRFRPDLMGRNMYSRNFKISFRPTLKASITHFGPFCIVKHVGRNERWWKSDKITKMCKTTFLEADWIWLEYDFGPSQIALKMS